LLSIVSCRSGSVLKSLEVDATSKGASTKFVLEHSDLYAENIRLKQALEICQKKK
jgi:hypothetical protein